MTIKKLQAGSVAFLWPVFNGSLPSINGEPERGYVVSDEHLLRVDALDESSLAEFKDRNLPEAILAATGETSALLLMPRRHASRRSFGYQASTRQWWASMAFAPVPLRDVRSTRLLKLKAHFPGLGQWSGVSSSNETDERLPSGRLKSWSVKVSAPAQQDVVLRGGRTLSLAGHWEVTGPQDRRVLFAPVSVSVTSRRATDPWNLLYPLLRFQDLVGIAYEGFVPAEGGSGLLDLAPFNDELPSTPEFWSALLMETNKGARLPESMSSPPFFHLQHVGGWPGVRRWIYLCEDHPRAVQPLINRYRHGDTSAHVRVLEICAAIEYWVKASRKEGRAWATKGPFVSVLSAHVGSAFTEWIGDPEAWSTELWDTYNLLKHAVTFEQDDWWLQDLAESARLLLTAALLNQVAVSKEPSRQIFGTGHRIWQLRDRLHERLKMAG